MSRKKKLKESFKKEDEIRKEIAKSLEQTYEDGKNAPDIVAQTKQLAEALRAGMESGLSQGAPLVIEDLDTSGFGLYLKKDPSVPEDDYFLTTYLSFGRPLYARKSEEGVKWRTFEDVGIKDWKELIKRGK